MPSTFTFAEANAALAVIRPLVAQILELRQTILDKQPEIWPVLANKAGNGGSQAASQVEVEFQKLRALVKQVNYTGAVLKDINSGLVDFPSLRDGRQVYLCWRYDEPEIGFWHALDTGFADRQPI